jgi:transposase
METSLKPVLTPVLVPVHTDSRSARTAEGGARRRVTAERARVSGKSDIGKAMDYMLKRWDGFTRFLHDGRICLTNNSAERALRGIALGRKSWLFCGSDRGGQRAAVMYSLIVTAKMNDVDPQAWLADVLARIADTSQNRLHELLPWNWKAARVAKTA